MERWEFLARPNQLPPPGDWDTWLLLSGRGGGKTRTLNEWIRSRIEDEKDPARRVGLVARTAADVRDVFIEGESGLLSVFPARYRPIYEPSKRRLTFHTGAIATTFSADKPDQLRGPQFDCAGCDELAAWRYPDAWDQLQFGLRLGKKPQVVVATTPRPTALIKGLVKEPGTIVTGGRTMDNAANLSKRALAKLQRKYAGTRLGRQELEGEILEDTPGALWSLALIDRARVSSLPARMLRLVVAIDPNTTSGPDSDEAGIIAAGLGSDGHGYVLDDVSVQDGPAVWSKVAVQTFKDQEADMVVAESNNGGEMVGMTIQAVDSRVPVKLVHASRGKRTRAEPIAMLYQQGRVHHLGVFEKLEDEMTTWVPGVDKESPNRVDALVWALTELMTEPFVPDGDDAQAAQNAEAMVKDF